MVIVEFLAWTFILYWLHRYAHTNKFFRKWHCDHHSYINKNGGNKSLWEPCNVLLIHDSAKSSIDLWITEILPTLVFCFITGAWWIFVFYYLWAACFQEIIEHKSDFDYYPFTSGRWHLIHHSNPTTNFGLFTPLWDKVFSTELKHT